MQTTKATKRYAKALLEYAIDKSQAEEIFHEMTSIREVILQNSELNQVLRSPIVKSVVKKTILEQVFNHMSQTTKRLVQVLLENKRLVLMPDIAHAYIQLYQEYKGKQIVYVTIAQPISEPLQSDILQKAKQITGNENMELKLKIDPSIIGGFVLRVGDLQYNASIANKLNTIRRNLQSGLHLNL